MASEWSGAVAGSQEPGGSHLASGRIAFGVFKSAEQTAIDLKGQTDLARAQAEQAKVQAAR